MIPTIETNDPIHWTAAPLASNQFKHHEATHPPRTHLGLGIFVSSVTQQRLDNVNGSYHRILARVHEGCDTFL